MSPSLPPGTNRRAFAMLDRATDVAQLLAALLVTLVSVRFAVAGVAHALDASEANFADRPVPHAPDDPAARSSATRLDPGMPSPSPGASVPRIAAGRSVRVTLNVSAGPPRSEVYVNGQRVGNTPFLGDTSCKTGQALRIEVVPNEGAPLAYVRTCEGGLLEVSGPPP